MSNLTVKSLDSFVKISTTLAKGDSSHFQLAWHYECSPYLYACNSFVLVEWSPNCDFLEGMGDFAITETDVRFLKVQRKPAEALTASDFDDSHGFGERHVPNRDSIRSLLKGVSDDPRTPCQRFNPKYVCALARFAESIGADLDIKEKGLFDLTPAKAEECRVVSARAVIMPKRYR